MRSVFLKYHRMFLFGLLFPVLFTSCQWARDIFPSDEKPQILSVQIPGIPDANIGVDQDKLIITVLLPDTLTALKIVPTFNLSKRAELLGNPPIIDLATYCPCAYNRLYPSDPIAPLINSSSPINQPIDLQQGTQNSHYRLVLKSRAPFSFRPLKTPVVWDYRNEPNIYVPVANYYGASYAMHIAIAKTGSGTPYGIDDDDCFNVCPGRLNQIGIPLSGLTYKDSTGGGIHYLTPGLYDLYILLADGTKAHASGAILVK